MIPDDPLCDPRALAAFLRAHHLPPLDRFGQHFLVDQGVLDEMVAASETDPAIPVIEIGAGLGVLTRALARERERRGGNGTGSRKPLVAIELDRRLIPLLRERVRGFPAVRIVHGDILTLPVETLLTRAPAPRSLPFDVIGSIPYNLTAPILEHFLAHAPRPRRMTLLLDDAVAGVLAARPPRMSLRAVSVQAFAGLKVVRGKIPPASFVPAPAVTSALVTLASHAHPLVTPEEEPAFFRLVRAGFSQKRKMLANALGATYHLAPATAARRLRQARIDPSRRAQTLSISEWKRLLRTWDVVHWPPNTKPHETFAPRAPRRRGAALGSAGGAPSHEPTERAALSHH